MAACCRSEEDRKAHRINKEIERRLIREHQYSQKEIMMVFLVGNRWSARSTFLKQFRILHAGSGYSEEERKDYTRSIHQNIVTAIQSIIHAMTTLQIPYTYEYNQVHASSLSEVHMMTLNPYVDAIKSLWNDPGVQECYSRREECQISDYARYYLDALDRIADSAYVPTLQDVLRASYPKWIIEEYRFPLRQGWVCRMLDVGVGSWDSWRKIRLSFFEKATAIVSVDPIDDWEGDLEESHTLRVTQRQFQPVYILLRLYEKDLLEEKIMVSHLVDYFSAYEGPRDEKEHIVRMFEDLNQCLHLRRQRRRGMSSAAPTP